MKKKNWSQFLVTVPCQRHDIQQVSILEHNQNLMSSNKHISSIYILQDKKACFTGIGTVYIKYKQKKVIKV